MTGDLPTYTYTVASVRPESVREDLKRIWRQNLALNEDPEAKFRRLYEDAPDAANSVLVLRAREPDLAEETIVGTIGICVRRFWLGGRDVRAALLADFAVDRAHRHLLPALQLARRASDLVREGFDVGYGFPNRNAIGVMLRAGFDRLGRTSRLVHVLRPSTYLARVRDHPAEATPATARLLSSPSIRGLVGPLSDLSRLALLLPRAARAACRHRLRWSTGLDTRADALWAAARQEYRITGERTSKFLAWRYPSARLAVLMDRSGDLRAHAVVDIEPETRMAHLRSVFGHPDSIEPLLDLLLPALWRLGAVSASVRILGAPQLRRILARRRFVPRGVGTDVVVLLGSRASESALAADPEAWHVFDADEDS